MKRNYRSHVAILLVAVMLAPSMASAGQAPGTASPTLAAIAAEHAARKQADRQTILNVLDRPEVRKLAKGADLPIDKAAAAVATLEGAELTQVLEQAKHVEDVMAGAGAGSRTLTIVGIIVLIPLLVLVLMFVSMASSSKS